MIAHDPAAFERLITDYLKHYHRYTKEMETGVEVVKDKYGTVLMTAPYLRVKLKDDADILADLAKIKQVRVVH